MLSLLVTVQFNSASAVILIAELMDLFEESKSCVSVSTINVLSIRFFAPDCDTVIVMLFPPL